MTRAMLLFSLATLAPVPLISGAALWGGLWALWAVIYLTILAFVLDELVRIVTPAEEARTEFPLADTLSVALALGHFAILGLSIYGLAGDWLSGREKLALFLSSGWFMGQVSNSNAHELIHRTSRGLHALGKWVYVSMLFGHHTSAHPLVHHVHVATPADPNSARLGQTYYGFLPRAWIGSFRAGLAAESARLRRAGRPKWRHPYLGYLGGAALCLALAAAIAGPSGVAWSLLLCGFAQSQLLLSDYVQHYGLSRATDPETGKPEPVGDKHSWNSPHWFTSGMMLNAPRHSDHHAHPTRHFPALRLSNEMPVLPRSLPAMGAIALVPPLWRRVMDPRVKALTSS